MIRRKLPVPPPPPRDPDDIWQNEGTGGRVLRVPAWLRNAPRKVRDDMNPWEGEGTGGGPVQTMPVRRPSRPGPGENPCGDTPRRPVRPPDTSQIIAAIADVPIGGAPTSVPKPSRIWHEPKTDPVAGDHTKDADSNGGDTSDDETLEVSAPTEDGGTVTVYSKQDGSYVVERTSKDGETTRTTVEPDGTIRGEDGVAEVTAGPVTDVVASIADPRARHPLEPKDSTPSPPTEDTPSRGGSVDSMPRGRDPTGDGTIVEAAWSPSGTAQQSASGAAARVGSWGAVQGSGLGTDDGSGVLDDGLEGPGGPRELGVVAAIDGLTALIKELRELEKYGLKTEGRATTSAPGPSRQGNPGAGKGKDPGAGKGKNPGEGKAKDTSKGESPATQPSSDRVDDHAALDTPAQQQPKKEDRVKQDVAELWLDTPLHPKGKSPTQDRIVRELEEIGDVPGIVVDPNQMGEGEDEWIDAMYSPEFDVLVLPNRQQHNVVARRHILIHEYVHRLKNKANVLRARQQAGANPSARREALKKIVRAQEQGLSKVEYVRAVVAEEYEAYVVEQLVSFEASLPESTPYWARDDIARDKLDEQIREDHYPTLDQFYQSDIRGYRSGAEKDYDRSHPHVLEPEQQPASNPSAAPSNQRTDTP